MKNLQILYEKDGIRDYLRANWQTNLFRQQQDIPGSLIHNVVERAAKYPLFIYDFSNHPSADIPDTEKTEWAHFGAWMGGVTKRHYPSIGIHDAYWLHELYHKGFMSYEPNMTFEGWKDKQFRNELNASMASEIELYMYYPEFRAETFNHDIYADRFLRNKDMMSRWQNDPSATRDSLRLKRREIMLRENKNDPVEYWIHKFAQQNEAWAGIWSRRYDQIETHMAQLRSEIDQGIPRKIAMDRFMSWLQSPQVTRNSEIPFYDEAVAFAGVYTLNIRHYQESIAHGDMGKDKARLLIEQAYPNTDPKEAIATHIMPAVFGEIPDYSGRQKFQISALTALMQGSFAVMYAADPTLRNYKGRKGDFVVVLQQRGDTGPDGEPRYGMCGGYTSLDNNPDKGLVQEQPDEGCVRKINYELLDDNAQPIIKVAPERLKIVLTGNDYRHDPGTHYDGFSLKLSTVELVAIKRHTKRMEEDGAYAKAVQLASKGSVNKILVLSLEEALKIDKNSFTHPHEFTALEKFATIVQARGSNNSRA